MIKNIGTVTEQEVQLCSLGVSWIAPIKTLAVPLQDDMDKFIDQVIKDILQNYPGIDLDKEPLCTEILLHVGTSTPDINNQYSLQYEISFFAWVGELDAPGTYCTHSVPIAVTLQDDEAEYMRNILIRLIADALI